MALYPALQQPPPWLNANELALEVTVGGLTVLGVPLQASRPDDIVLGLAGVEGEDPRLLVRASDVESLGDLHGAAVVIDGENFVVRNVRKNKNLDYIKLILDAR